MVITEGEHDDVTIDIEDNMEDEPGTTNHLESESPLSSSSSKRFWKMLASILKILIIVVILEIIGQVLGIDDIIDRHLRIINLMNILESRPNYF